MGTPMAAVPIGARITFAVDLWEHLPQDWPAEVPVIVQLTRAEMRADGTWRLTITRVPPDEEG